MTARISGLDFSLCSSCNLSYDSSSSRFNQYLFHRKKNNSYLFTTVYHCHGFSYYLSAKLRMKARQNYFLHFCRKVDNMLKSRSIEFIVAIVAQGSS